MKWQGIIAWGSPYQHVGDPIMKWQESSEGNRVGKGTPEDI